MLLSQLQGNKTFYISSLSVNHPVDLLFVSELSGVLEPVVEEKINGLLALSESLLQGNVLLLPLHC